MAAAWRKYFSTHHDDKARAAFVKAQRATLKALEVAVSPLNLWFACDV